MTALALKSTFVIFAALLFVFAARRTRASLRHMVLAALFAFLLLLPLAERVVPAVKIPEEKLSRVVQASGLPSIPQPPPAGRPEARTTPRVPILPIYLTGVSLLLAWLAIGVVRLRRLAAGGEVWLEGTARMNEIASESNIRRPALVVLSDETKVPLTFGFRVSTIVLPYAAKSWDAESLGRALRHELEHVRRDDWVLQLVARAVCALYWPHPLVWAAWRRFCFEAERACDDAVVGSFAGAEAYAGQLVSLARSVRRISTVPALGMASPSKLSARVRALLDRTQRRGPHSRLATAFAFGVAFLFLFTVGPAQLVAAAKEQQQRRSAPKNWSWFGEAMAEAGKAGDIDRIRELVDAGVDVNTVAEGDGTALIGASKGGHLELVRFLIARGADVNLASRGDGNPLIAAAAHGHADVVELLLDEGAKIDEMVFGDENALIKAAWHGHADVVRLLIRRGANVNARYDEDGEIRTPLRMARRGGYDEIVRILRTAGASE
jgi:bla regulator protein blaR1